MSNTNERAEFEAWASHPDRHGKLPIEAHPNGAYKDNRTYTAYYGWAAAKKTQAQQVAVPFIKHPTPAHHTSDFATEHLRDVVDYAKGINAALELWIASAQSGVTTPCPVVYTKTSAIDAHHKIGANS